MRITNTPTIAGFRLHPSAIPVSTSFSKAMTLTVKTNKAEPPQEVLCGLYNELDTIMSLMYGQEVRARSISDINECETYNEFDYLVAVDGTTDTTCDVLYLINSNNADELARRTTILVNTFAVMADAREWSPAE